MTQIQRRRRARLNPKQQPMTPGSSPAREVSEDKEGCPEPTTVPSTGHEKQPQPQQPEGKHDGIQLTDRPADRLADRLSIQAQVARAVSELEGLSLDIDNFVRVKSENVRAASGDEEEEEEHKKNADPEGLVSPFEDSEGGSQTSSDESWASLPPSGSCSTDSSSSDTEEEEGGNESAPGTAAHSPPPSPEMTFRFHEEFDGGGGDDDSVVAVADDNNDNDGDGPEQPPPQPPGEEECTIEEGQEEDAPCPVDTGSCSSRAIPKWAFLRSSNSMPVLGLGPEDFHHGGSALRYEVSTEDEEKEDEEDEEDEGSGQDSETRSSQDIATVGVVYL